MDSKRDWGDARDFVKGMWLILQNHKSDDFVLATGEQHSVREFVELAFRYTGRDIAWSGKGLDEKGKDKNTGEVLVEIDKRYFRPIDVESLVGDASKASSELGWRPENQFESLVEEMVNYDRELLREKHGR